MGINIKRYVNRMIISYVSSDKRLTCIYPMRLCYEAETIKKKRPFIFVTTFPSGNIGMIDYLNQGLDLHNSE